jgi:hypothetical protein
MLAENSHVVWRAVSFWIALPGMAPMRTIAGLLHLACFEILIKKK